MTGIDGDDIGVVVDGRRKAVGEGVARLGLPALQEGGETRGVGNR